MRFATRPRLLLPFLYEGTMLILLFLLSASQHQTQTQGASKSVTQPRSFKPSRPPPIAVATISSRSSHSSSKTRLPPLLVLLQLTSFLLSPSSFAVATKKPKAQKRALNARDQNDGGEKKKRKKKGVQSYKIYIHTVSPLPSFDSLSLGFDCGDVEEEGERSTGVGWGERERGRRLQLANKTRREEELMSSRFFPLEWYR